MSKRKQQDTVDNVEPFRKRSAVTFKLAWLNELIETETVESKQCKRVELGNIFTFSDDNGVICKICFEAKSSCDFAVGKSWDQWKLDYLKRHLLQKVHLDSLAKLKRLKSGTGIKSLMTESAEYRQARIELNDRKRAGENVKILIDNVLLAISMNSSILSVQEIHDHMAKYVSLPESWRSKNYAFEFVECINGVIQETIMTEIRESAFHTLIVDESTDISVTKMLILYIKYRPVTTNTHKTYFAGIVKLTACDSKAIFCAIKQFYLENKLDCQKMVMFTSDGASVMLGKRNGVAALLRTEVPHLLEQHCVAHREDLGIDDAWKNMTLIKDIELLLRTIYTTFSRSSVKKAEFEELANVADHDIVSFRPLNEVRWMSRHFAVKALVRNYSIAIEYFQKHVDEDSDPLSSFCLKKLRDTQVHVAIFVLNDILAELAELCCVFQRSNITTIEAVQFAKAKFNKLKAQYLGETKTWSKDVNELLLKDGYAEVDTTTILRFIERVCIHLQDRFPDGELKEWIAFDTQTIKTQNSFEFGNDNVLKLAAKYEQFFHLHPGKQNGDNGIKEVICKEYSEFKFVLTEKLNDGTLKTFSDVISYALTEEKFSSLAPLIDICGTFQASSADAERGFSLMNNIKTKSRNRLGVDHLDMLMRIKFYITSGRLVNLDHVYKYWKDGKKRRQKIPDEHLF